MLSLLVANIRLVGRTSLTLLNGPKPTNLAHKQFCLLQNTLTRPFVTSSRVAFPPKVTETEAKENSPKPKKKPTKRASPKRKKASKVAKKTTKKAPKPKIDITPEMRPPPRPLTAYLYFSMEWFSKLPKSQSIAEQASRARECGNEWRALSDSEKQPYLELSLAGREEYRTNHRQWLENVDPVVLKELNKRLVAKGKRRIKGIKGPKSDRPLGPFIQFLSEFRLKQDQKLRPQECTRLGGEAWRALPGEEKQQYFDRFSDERRAWLERQSQNVPAHV